MPDSITFAPTKGKDKEIKHKYNKYNNKYNKDINFILNSNTKLYYLIS